MPSVPLDPDETGPPAEPPRDIAGLFPVERARLTELLRGLSEYWIHRQQLLQALGRPSDLRADLAAPVLDGLRC